MTRSRLLRNFYALDNAVYYPHARASRQNENFVLTTTIMDFKIKFFRVTFSLKLKAIPSLSVIYVGRHCNGASGPYCNFTFISIKMGFGEGRVVNNHDGRFDKKKQQRLLFKFVRRRLVSCAAGTLGIRATVLTVSWSCSPGSSALASRPPGTGRGDSATRRRQLLLELLSCDTTSSTSFDSIQFNLYIVLLQFHWKFHLMHSKSCLCSIMLFTHYYNNKFWESLDNN